MSLNIGSMLRTLMGEMQADGARALELRVGQIVRGVLLEMLDNHEALMNINGVQVRAKLETDLPVGAGTLLQVQPGSNAGTISLKPLAEPGEHMADEGMKDVQKSFGLPDQKWSIEMIRGLKRDGYPIGKETAAYFQSASGLKPAGIDKHSWMASADVAFRRGLNVTTDTLGSLRQALFGPPVHEQMADLASALKMWQSTGAGKSGTAEAMASRLQALLTQGESLLAQGEAQLLAGAGEPAFAGGPGDAAGRQQTTSQPGEARFTEVRRAAASASDGRADAAILTPASAAVEVDPVGGTSEGAQPRLTASGINAAAHPAQVVQEQVKPGEVRELISTDAATSQSAAAGREPGTAQSKAATKEEAAWIGRFLQWLGAGHEHGLVRIASETRLPSEQGRWALDVPAGNSGQDSDPAAARTAADSLKSVLLTLAAHEETPYALREAAQALVSQITGQQLLLSSERQPNAPYSLMTLFLPMKGQDGETAATVHVQTRRGRRGEWDTDNCRLLFDLRMLNVGDTIVDVQVTDRIVSVKLMNDFPGMAALVEHAKGELTGGLQTAGFQLLSMTAVPLPSYKQPDAAETGDLSEPPVHVKSASYAVKKYKGVDYRV